MRSPIINLAALIVVVAEAGFATYLCLLAWMMSAWMAGDSWAFRATDFDWLEKALLRFAGWAATGIVAGVGLGLFNRWLGTRGVFPAHVARVSGIAIGAAVVVAAALGSAKFLVERPYM